jgi:hypothetical protein
MAPQTSENALFCSIQILIRPTFFVTTLSDSNEVSRVTAIIDWNNVGYLPKFYMATLPRGRYHFAVEDQPEGFDWMWMLSNALVEEGFPLEMDYLTRTTPSWTFVGTTCQSSYLYITLILNQCEVKVICFWNSVIALLYVHKILQSIPAH